MSSVLAHLAASDTRLYSRLLASSPPAWVRIWMVSASRLSDSWLWPGVVLLLVSAGAYGHRVLAGAAVAAGLANIALVVLKDRVRRPRPRGGDPGTSGIRSRAYFPADCYSFPSGHALNAFAVGSLLALSFPPFAAAVLVVAASIAASRVLLGEHYLTDVVAGVVLGSVAGTTVFLCWLL
jgi:undecaprenyl-diphosphatase